MFKQPETKSEPGAPKARNLNLDSLRKLKFHGHNTITNVKSNDSVEFETHWVHNTVNNDMFLIHVTQKYFVHKIIKKYGNSKSM